MNLIFVKIYDFNFSKKNKYLISSILQITYITSEFNFYEKKTETLLTQFWVIIYITSELNFYEKNKHFIGSIFG